jgi:hypothetical protein
MDKFCQAHAKPCADQILMRHLVLRLLEPVIRDIINATWKANHPTFVQPVIEGYLQTDNGHSLDAQEAHIRNYAQS